MVLLAATLSCPAALADKKQLAKVYADKATVQNLQMSTRSSALSHINQAIAMDNNNAYYYHIKASIYWKQEEDQPALDNINRAIELNPGVAAFYETKACILQTLGRTQDALATIDKALKMQDSLEYHVDKASILTSLRRFNEAKVELDKLIKENPKNPIPRVRRVTVNNNLKNWPGVIEDMDFLIGFDDKNTISYYMHFVDRANAYMMLKQYDKAEKDLQFAVKKMPDLRETHRALLALYKATGRSKEANAELAKMADLDDDIRPFK